MSENNKNFDITQLLNFLNPKKVNFSPKISQKLWEDAEILMLGSLVKYLKSKGLKNQELKQAINERLENFEKKRKEKSYSLNSINNINEINEASLELDKIKKARDEVNLLRFINSKKLSDKTKKLLNEAYKKALLSKTKKENIIIENKVKDNNSEKKQIDEISSDEAKKVNEMLNIAVKSGVIKKQDLGLKK